MRDSYWAGPKLEEVQEARRTLAGRAITTPVTNLYSDRIRRYLPVGSNVTVKLELFQQTGSFKSRGALLSLDKLSHEEQSAGVVTASAGNHALALSWAAKNSNVQATVVMPQSADTDRVRECVELGAEVVLEPDIGAVFQRMDELRVARHLTAIHPYENKNMLLGSGTCGLEFLEQVNDLDVIIVPIGGGGLIGGIGAIVKQLTKCQVIGVEPSGAALMSMSIEAGRPLKIDSVKTVADSLGAPVSLPMSFEVVRQVVDDIVLVADEEMIIASSLYFDSLKLSVEPACAAGLAAICGPLRKKLQDKKVGLVACGTNISPEKSKEMVEHGRTLLKNTSI